MVHVGQPNHDRIYRLTAHLRRALDTILEARTPVGRKYFVKLYCPVT